MRAALVLTVLVALALPAAASASALVEIPVAGPGDAGRLAALGLDTTHGSDQDVVRAIVDEADRERVRAAGFEVRDVIADLEAARTRARQREERAARRGAPSNLRSGNRSYRVLADYTRELGDLAARHPGLVRRVDLPRTSREGRPLAGVEIASDVNLATDGRPAYVVMGAHHAREWPSAEVNMEFALDLARGYGTDPRITRLLDRVRVFVFPVINPDGFVASRGTDPDTLSGTNPNQRVNSGGVDLNRNYGAFWGGNGASTIPGDPVSQTYRGPSAWSEPESAAVHEFSQRLHITNFQSIHNVAALVLRPPGFKALGLAPDEERLRVLGDAMGRATGYASEYGYELYEVTGATEDWNYVAQNAFVYTIELGPADGDFQGPFATHVIEQYLGRDGSPAGADGTREALLLAGEQAADPRDHAVLQGTAPPGAVLRLRKRFTTTTSEVCLFQYPGGSAECPLRGEAQLLDDGLDTSLVVPASGRYEWHVTPSTRPFERKAGRTEAWTLSCESGGRELDSRALEIAIGERKEGDPCTPGSAFRTVSPAEAPMPTPLPGTPSVVPAPPRAVAPIRPGLRVTLARQRRATVLARGVLVSAACATDCTLAAQVGKPSRARGTAVLGRRTLRLRAGRQVRFRVKLSAAGRRAVRRYRHPRLALRLATAGGTTSRSVQLVGR